MKRVNLCAFIVLFLLMIPSWGMAQEDNATINKIKTRVTNIYHQILSGTSIGKVESQFLTESYRELKNNSEEALTIVEWFDAEDWDSPKINVENVKQEGNNCAYVDVSVTDMGEKRTVRLKMIQTDGEWLVDDFQGKKGWVRKAFFNEGVDDILAGLATVTEEVSYAEFPRDSTIVSGEYYEKYSFFNDWYPASERKKEKYRIALYEDGTTKIEDKEGNWARFKTQYGVNEYTGERDTTPIKAETIMESESTRRNIELIAAKRVIPDGYVWTYEDKKVSMKTPLGITFSKTVEGAKLTAWFDDWFYTSMFYRSYNKYFGDTGWGTVNRKRNEFIVTGPQGNVLTNMENIAFSILGGTYTKGGYYDPISHIMYYSFGRPKIIGNACPDGYIARVWPKQGVDIDQTMKDALLLYQNKDEQVPGVNLVFCIPSDQISRVEDKENVSEIYYANGDYLKISKLKQGKVFDCSVHRPMGLWTVKQDSQSGDLKSEFTFSSGKYKGLVYKDKIEYADYAICLSVPGMVTVNMLSESGIRKNAGIYDEAEMFDPSINKLVFVSLKNGEINERERKAAMEREQQAENNKKINAIKQIYYNKYGKDNVDMILNQNDIKVGMPFSVVSELCNCNLQKQNAMGKWYKVTCGGHDYDFNNNKIIPKKVTVGLFTTKCIILVSNGVVKSIDYLK